MREAKKKKKEEKKRPCDSLRKLSRLKWEDRRLCFLTIMDRVEADVQESLEYINPAQPPERDQLRASQAMYRQHPLR